MPESDNSKKLRRQQAKAKLLRFYGSSPPSSANLGTKMSIAFHVIGGAILMTFFWSFAYATSSIRQWQLSSGEYVGPSGWIHYQIELQLISAALIGSLLGGLVWIKRLCDAQNLERRLDRIRNWKPKNSFPEELGLPARSGTATAFEQRLQEFVGSDSATNQPASKSSMPLWIAPQVECRITPPRPATFFRSILLRIRGLLRQNSNDHDNYRPQCRDTQ